MEPAPPGCRASRPARDPGARRSCQPGGRGQRLDAGGPGPDRAVGARPVHLARHRRVRVLRHPGRRPPVLPRGRGVDHAGRAVPARPPGRGEAGGARPGAAARLGAFIALVLVLAACGAGPQAVAGRGAGSGSPRAALAEQRQDNAEAARAVAALQRRYGAGGYRATRSWQSANALDATIDYMRASGSPDFLADLKETFRVHHGRDNFLNGYYDDEGWWALTWINAYNLT